MKRLLLIIILIITPLLFLASPQTTKAQANAQGWTEPECTSAGGLWYSNTCLAKPPEVELQIPVGALTSGEIDIATYIKTIYNFGVAAAAVLAVMMIIIGGFIWLTAGGNQERVTTARGYITGAIIGLIIALGSFTLLAIINPSLVFFAPLKIPMVKTAFFGDFCPEKVEKGVTVICDASGSSPLKEGRGILCGWRCEISEGEGGSKKSCVGTGSSDDNFLCLPGIIKDKVNNIKFVEAKPSDACNVWRKETTEDLGLPANQSTCDKINQAIMSDPTPTIKLDNIDKPNPGGCVWINKISGWFPWLGDYGDGCYWCDSQSYLQVRLKIEDGVKEGKTKNEICNRTGSSWFTSFMSNFSESSSGLLACWENFCFGSGRINRP